MVDGVFTPGFDPRIVFADRISRNFVPRSEVADIIPKWRMRLFEEPFQDQEIAAFVQKSIGNGLAGRYHRKKCLIAVGRSNTCKGTTTLAIQVAIDGFFGTFNVKSMCDSKFDTTDSKANSWLCMIATNELYSLTKSLKIPR